MECVGCKSKLRVLFDLYNQQSLPFCKHGPLLFFERIKEAETERFYACSAFRDNKCEHLTKYDANFDYYILRLRNLNRLRAFLKLEIHQRKFCRTCSKLLLPEEGLQHDKHSLIKNIKKSDLRKPTKLLRPQSINQKEAQFYFDKKTISFIIETLNRLNLKRLILIGCPSIHETIQSQKNKLQMESILLDIDTRMAQFYCRRSFLLFNMFNNYFFEGDNAITKFIKYIRETYDCNQLCVLIDPPFGGFVSAIAKTIKSFNRIVKEIFPHAIKLNVILINPYFMEKHIKEHLSDFFMCDYKINYKPNHKLKLQVSGMKNASIVRMFTNIELCKIVLPEDGYNFCELCKRYVANENKHCFKCKNCTSKNGRPSRHCDKCGKCFKNTWKHCEKCNICCLPEQCPCKSNIFRIQN